MIFQTSTAFLITLLLTLLPAAWTHAEDSACKLLSTPYTATYFGSYKGWRIDTTQQLTNPSPGHWALSMHADNFLGSIREEANYQFTAPHKPQSISYSYQRKLPLNNTSLTTTFDWQAKRAVTQGSKTGEVALTGAETDNLTYQLQLRCDLMNEKTPLMYPLFVRDEIDNIEFKITGEEVLDTTLGKLNTVVVKRVRNNSKRFTTLWFAKDKDYLMVKLLQEERKDTEAYLLYINSYQK